MDEVVFDDAGEVKSYGGNPILLNGSVAKDPTISAMVADYKRSVTGETLKEAGKVKRIMRLYVIS